MYAFASAPIMIEVSPNLAFQDSADLVVPAGTYLVQGGYTLGPSGSGITCDIATLDSSSVSGRRVLTPAGVATIVNATGDGLDQIWLSAVVTLPSANNIQLMCSNPSASPTVLFLKNFTATKISTLHQQ
jgi:hypothetical protein